MAQDQQGGVTFSSSLHAEDMVSVLRAQMPQVEWKLEGRAATALSLRGRTQEGIIVKIDKGRALGEFYLRVYTYQANPPIEASQREAVVAQLQSEVLDAVERPGETV